MAVINATLANEAFDIRLANEVAFLSRASPLGATGQYDWNTTGSGYVFTNGAGYSYDGSGNPTNGTVNHIQIGLSVPPGGTDIDITGIALDLEQLVQPALSADAFANAFWLEALSGDDTITGANSQTFIMAGDGRNIAAGQTLIGRNDRITGGTGGTSAQQQILYGDVDQSFGTVIGGNDILVGRGQFYTVLMGDVGASYGFVAGGNDVLRLEAVAAYEGSKLLVGDVSAAYLGSHTVGGNDHITGSQFSDWRLVGDVNYMAGNVLFGGDDEIHGLGGNDFIYGDYWTKEGYSIVRGGNDRLFGGAGNDEIWGNGGSDYIDGGADSDTARFTDLNMTGHALVRVGNTLYVSQIVDDATDTLVDVENVNLTGSNVATSSIAQFGGLSYVASHLDLVAAFRGGAAGAINQAGAQHYAFTGYFEGRLTEGEPLFDAQAYVNSYADLRTAFGTGMTLNVNAATLHFINHGSVEGRLGFDGLAYIASYADLRSAFGTNQEAGAQHFRSTGRTEGRDVLFDAQQYLDNYADLAGLTLSQAARHFILSGASEGRTFIDPLDYVASYADLIQAFGDYGSAPNAASLGRDHYVSSGRASGRTTTFDAWQYLENYDDLTAAFGRNVDQAAHHFIQYGFYEGRTDDALFA
ncbi:MAG TPA: hypothetical protein VGN97_04385 [Mesorhizobium sp.]|jgi:hypothetical protein|nr:hypothetical protein [Mesorhizobium sp.]